MEQFKQIDIYTKKNDWLKAIFNTFTGLTVYTIPLYKAAVILYYLSEFLQYKSDKYSVAYISTLSSIYC